MFLSWVESERGKGEAQGASVHGVDEVADGLGAVKLHQAVEHDVDALERHLLSEQLAVEVAE
ncbi:MAG: hypothetical protein CL844_04900 [Crocinitomicaceae bacterium]|nr:hypothetical protein [Crocinitomicaceae bacterium]